VARASTATAAAPLTRSREDAAVKSIRNLLWLLWGLGWVIVPLLVHRLEIAKDTIPLVMFGSLASLFVVTWHKGAAIRALLRMMHGASGDVNREESSASHRVRVVESKPRVDVGHAGKVRVHAGESEELRPDEVLGRTQRRVGSER
jgi:hypothetical protein